jgi:hypothetical protein
MQHNEQHMDRARGDRNKNSQYVTNIQALLPLETPRMKRKQRMI